MRLFRPRQSDPPVHRNRGGVMVLALVGAMWALAGCRKVATVDPADSPAVDSSVAESRPPRQLPPPPFMTERLVRLEGQALQKANLSLDQIVAKLPCPDYLAEAKQASKGDSSAKSSDRNTDAPPQAVKDYIEVRTLIQEGRIDEALDMLRKVIQADPSAAPAFRMLGRLYLQNQDGSLASIYFRQAARLDHGDVESLFHIGRIALSERQSDQAIVTFAAAEKHFTVQTDPGLRDLVYYYMGKTLMQQGYLTEAIDRYSRFLAVTRQFDRSSRYLRAVMLLRRHESALQLEQADALARLGRFSQAKSIYDQLGANPKVNQGALLPRLIYLDLVLHQSNRALARFDAQVNWTHPRPGMMRWLAYLAKYTENRPAFLHTLRALYQKNDRPESLAMMIHGWLAPAEQVPFLRKDLRRHPDHLRVYQQLVDQLWSTDSPAVVKLTVGLLNDRADLATDYFNLLLDDRDRQLELAETVGRMDAATLDTPAGWYCRGRVAQVSNRPEQAAEAYRAALDRKADFLAARWGLIELQIDDDHYDQALRMIDAVAGDHPRKRLLRAVVMDRMRRWDQAITILDQLIADDPTNADYLNRKAMVQLRKRDFTGAEQTFRKALTADPTNEAAYTGLFSIYESIRPDARKFQLLLQQLRFLMPQSRLVQLKLARYHMLRREYDKAETILRDLLKKRPGDGPALSNLVELLLSTDRDTQALELLNHRLDAHPADSLALDLLRRTARHRFDPTLFYTRYETYLLGLPDTPDNQLRLAGLYQVWNRPGKAIDLVRKVLEQSTDRSFELLVQLAELYRADGQVDEALDSVDRALAIRNDTVILHIFRAQLLHDLKRDDQAANALRHAQQRFPKQKLELRQALAELYMKMGRHATAQAIADALIADYPEKSPAMYYFKAQLFMLADREDQAEQMLLKSHQADPDYIHANNDLGYTWANRGVRLDQAEQMIGKAVEAEPSNPAYMDSMGWVFYKQGRFDQAVKWLRRAVLMPGGADPTVLDHLGDALWRNGQTDKAAEHWRIARRLLERQSEQADSPSYRRLAESLKQKLAAIGTDHPPAVAPVPLTQPTLQPQAVDR